MQGKSKSVDNRERPKCDICDFGRGHCEPDKIKETNKSTMKKQYIKNEYILTG